MIVSNGILESGISLKNLKTYQVGALEAAAHRALRQHKDSLLRDYGITGIEWYLIGAVHDAGEDGIRITDLAKMLGTTLGFLTKTVNMLEAKGILTRKANARDARSNYVILRKSYYKTCSEIERELRAKLRKSVYGLITPEELRTYIYVISKFTEIEKASTDYRP